MTRVRRLAVASFVPALGVLLLLGWQLSLFRSNLPDDFTLKAASGLHAERKFVYFLYYLDLFPVASLKQSLDSEFYFDGRDPKDPPPEPDTLEYNASAARRVISESGSTLVMEWGHTSRFGMPLAPYLFLVDAWRLGSPQHAEIRIAASLAFMLGLAGLFVACWVTGLRLLGSLLVVFLGSNPFELYEAYRRENVFGWPIITFVLALALMMPILRQRGGRWYAWAAAIVSGALFGTGLQIRPEVAVVFLAVIFLYIVAPGVTRIHRAALIATACLVFLVTAACWARYFDHKWRQATEVVTKAGGHPYLWRRWDVHPLWASLWGGLGDFDTKYGYAWKDSVIHAYGQVALREKYGKDDLPWWYGNVKGKPPHRTADDYFDAAQMYYRHPSQTLHFDEVLRDKVLHDIVHDPVWYLSILTKRAWRVLDQTTPVQVRVTPDLPISLPFKGYFTIAVLLVAAIRRDRLALSLIMCAVPLSLPALAIYSGRNMPYYSVFHICAAAIVLTWIVEWAMPRRAVPSPIGAPPRAS